MSDIPARINSGPWMLDPNIAYLNHGSFGARTVEVFDAQQRYKREFERSPIDFLDRRLTLINDSRHIVAQFVGADPEGFGFVENATTGVGCVIHSLQLEKGDEILTTNHVYNGVRQLLKHHCSSQSLHYRELDIPLPIYSSDEIIQQIHDGLTDQTKLLVIDHVASSSSIIFPVEEITKICRKNNILIFIDGAHVPGMLDLKIDELDPDWYVANLHKWVCAPVGAAFVWTNKKFRSTTHPMTVSHWLHQGYTDEFNWQGTRDISPWLAAVDAIKVGDRIGWDKIRQHNHHLATTMQKELVSAWGVDPLSPLDGSMLGSMATVLLPNDCPQTIEACIEMRDQIYSNNAIEVSIFEFQGKGMLRVSAQLYSKKQDITCLLEAIEKVI